MPFWRKSDPATSAAAALSIPEVQVRDSQKRILELLALGAATDNELRIRYLAGVAVHGWPEVSDSGLRSRRSELVALGLVQDSQRREKLPSRRNAIVWELVK
jgi:hypothetical protein